MELWEAMERRHTVRRYTEQRLPAEIVQRLEARIQANNRTHGLSMKLVTENSEAFQPVLRLILARSVRNYVVLAAEAGPDSEMRLGYGGADVMLYAQTLGLNTWWVGGTFSRKGARRGAETAAHEAVSGVLVVGYGAVQGKPHRSKSPEEISSYSGPAPAWFARGVKAVLLAPTALNRQAFIIRGEGGRVSMRCENGAFSGIDLGIGRYYFEAGAGKEHFDWAP